MLSSISKEKIQKKSKEFGFDIIKITEPEIHKKDRRYIKDFLDNNFHGDMDWLEKNLERRLSPKKNMAGCKEHNCSWSKLRP